MLGEKVMHYTYILRSLSHPEQRYIGSTSDLHARIAKHNAQPYRQQHFAPLFRQKSLKRAGRKSLEHYFLLSTIYKKRYSKDLVYQIDGAKVGFPPLLLRLLICQVLLQALCKNQKSSIWVHPFYIMPDIQ